MPQTPAAEFVCLAKDDALGMLGFFMTPGLLAVDVYGFVHEDN